MKKVDLETRKREKAHVTKELIRKGLERLGLKRGDIIGVHSSLSSFGYVEGGADAVIDALLETVGEEGTIVMPTYSANRENVERTQREAELGVTWKSRVLPYDPEKTPCWTGRIPETFRKRRNAVRSLDPAHSLAAIGPRANELIEDWDRLLEADGYILLLGVDLEVCSAMHLAERRVQLPPHVLKKTEPPRELLKRYGEDLGWPEWDIGFGPYPNFAKMEEPCREHGIMKTVKIGEATVRLLKLCELIDLYAEYLGKDPPYSMGPSEPEKLSSSLQIDPISAITSLLRVLACGKCQSLVYKRFSLFEAHLLFPCMFAQLLQAKCYNGRDSQIISQRRGDKDDNEHYSQGGSDQD